MLATALSSEGNYLLSVAFLFGAGASAFSGNCLPHSPPLGSGLFSELVKQGGIATTAEPDIVALFNHNFETGMAEFRKKHETDTAKFLRDMARYFAQFSVEPGNFYLLLIKMLINAPRRAVLATLNYDLLIEIAISKLERRVTYDGLPVESDNFSVLKLHGSCNFLPDLGSGGIHGIDIVVQPGASALEAGIKAVDSPEVVEFCDKEDSLAPAIALYAKGKHVLFCPGFVKAQQVAWRKAVEKASQIFVIGVRVNDEDAHVWLPMRKSKAKLFYVGPESQDIFDWAKLHNRRQTYHLAESFEAAIPRIEKLVCRI
jgi:hypothetical protein